MRFLKSANLSAYHIRRYRHWRSQGVPASRALRQARAEWQAVYGDNPSPEKLRSRLKPDPCRICGEYPGDSPDYPGVCRWSDCEREAEGQELPASTCR